MITVLFVCLGNICRSPMAEAVLQNLVDKAGLSNQFHIDSVGTGNYHVGDSAHQGTRRILKEHGITYVGQSRQINQMDLEQADYIIAMDNHNMSDLHNTVQGGLLEDRLFLLLDFADSTIKDVPDPYYTGNFAQVYKLVNAGCHGLLNHIKQTHHI